jgi:hypothetical protein
MPIKSCWGKREVINHAEEIIEENVSTAAVVDWRGKEVIDLTALTPTKKEKVFEVGAGEPEPVEEAGVGIGPE